MSFLETVEKARSFLHRNGRVSLRALRMEFELDDEQLEVLIDELVEIQRVAVRAGRALEWFGGESTPPAARSPILDSPENFEAASPIEASRQPASEVRPAPTLEGERKQATVFFADVKGSTALTEQAGAERWAGVLDGYVRLLEAGVRRFDGTVAQYTGDGIMALFGAPIAHEDHAQRACLAALWLRDALQDYAEQVRAEHGLDLRVRIGINSGEIVMGKIGEDLGVDFTAQGHTVHVAQRMEQLADDGVPCLAPATAALVEGYFELEDRGEFEVKGASKPLHVHALVGVGRAKTRLEAGRSRGLSRFVGRVHEMETLDSALAQAREGRGQVVGVVGEAGVGKSRLCAEFLDRASAAGAAVHQGHCLVHAKTVSYLPMLELLRSMLGVDETEDEAEQRRVIADELRDLDASFVETIPLVFDFLGVSDPERPTSAMAPEARQRQLFDFVRQLVHATGTREPTVLFVDDVHWIDPGSDGFLAQLVEAVAPTRTLLLLNFRPEYRADWMTGSGYHQLALARLAKDEAEALLDALLGDDASLETMRALIRERSGGNPFFVEEVVRSLEESGRLEGERGRHRRAETVEAIEVPATVQPVLAARIDRLAEREKQVLQAASVIGREFSEPILSAVLDWPALDLSEALKALEDRDFIHVRSLYPVTEYAFKHPLTQEVALGAQLRGRRARTHAAVARALENAHADHLDRHAALIAHHYEEGGQRLDSARWHQRAATWIIGSDPFESDLHWKRVYELARTERSSIEFAGLMLEACVRRIMNSFMVGLPDEERDQLAAEGRELAESSDNQQGLFMLEFGITLAKNLGGWADEAPLDTGQRAVELSKDLHPHLQFMAQLNLGNISWAAGRVDEGLRATESALELAGADLEIGLDFFGFSAPNLGLFQKASLLMWQGRLGQAAKYIQTSYETACDREEYGILGQITGTYGAELGDLVGMSPRALELCEEAVDYSRRYGDHFGRTVSLLHLGWAQLRLGRVSEALEALVRVDSFIREDGYARNFLNLAQGLLAEAYLAAGDHASARAAALRCTVPKDTWVHELRANLSRARVLRALDGAASHSEIEQSITRAQQLVEMSGALAFVPFIIEERARLHEVNGDPALAAQTLHAARTAFAEIEATGHVERLDRELTD